MNDISRNSSTVIAWIGIVATVTTVLVGIYQYSHSKEQEFRRAFWEKQFELYNEVTELASKIASADDLKNVEEERLSFWHLYWGRMSIVENQAVFDAMVAFGDELKESENSGLASAELTSLSYRLARACRDSLKATWEPVKLDNIPRSRSQDGKK